MLRRSVITTLAAALALSTLGPPLAGADTGEVACPNGAPAPGFTDVPPDATHAEAIACAVARDVVEGQTATTFAPGADVTRGQFASLLARTLDELDLPLPPAAGARTFPDAGSTHGQAIHRLAAAGIVTGRADGTFGPSEAITRAQLATLAVRAWSFVLGAELSAGQSDRFDDVEAGSTHAANIDAAAELGLLLGRRADEFAPDATTRRDQAATLVVRILANAPARLVGEIWGLDQGTDRIHVYSGDDHAEIVTIDVSPSALAAAGFANAPTGPNTVPHMIEFDSQERYAFVAATAGAATIVIDARSKEVVEVLATGAGSHMAAVTPDDSAVWVAAIGTRQLVEIPLDLDADEPSFAIGRQLDVADLLEPIESENGWAFPSYAPICHQFSTDSSEAWVTLGPGWNQGGFFVLDLASGTAAHAWDPTEVKANCGIAVGEDQVLANWSGQLIEDDYTEGEWYVFDADTKQLLRTESAQGFDAHGLRATPDGSAYWLVNRASDNAIVIDAETLEVVAEYANVAVAPDILDYNADGSRVYVTQRGPAPRSGAIHAAAGDEPGVRVIDTATGETIEVIEPAAMTDTEGGILNDLHGVGFRVRGDGTPVTTAEAAGLDLATVLPVRAESDIAVTCHLPRAV